MAGAVLQNPFINPKQPQQQQQQPSINNPAQNIQQQNTSINAPGNNQNNNNNLEPNKDAAGDDPMLKFAELWDNPPDDPKNPRIEEPTTFLPTIDPAKLTENFNKIDFSKYASPEEVAAIKAGGENAAAAHMSVLNKSMRQAMLTMFTASQRMTEAGLTRAQERFLKQVPSHVKDIMVESNLTKSSKLMSNPAYSPVIEAARKRFQEKFPKATPDQISVATEKYIQSMVEEATKKDDPELPDNAKKLQKGDTDADWEKWIEPELQKSL